MQATISTAIDYGRFNVLSSAWFPSNQSGEVNPNMGDPKAGVTREYSAEVFHLEQRAYLLYNSVGETEAMDDPRISLSNNTDRDHVLIQKGSILLYQKIQIEGIEKGSKSDRGSLVSERINLLWKDLEGHIRDFQKRVREALMSQYKQINPDTEEPTSLEEPKVEELEIPEYWNADNTAKRIVDFAQLLYLRKAEGMEADKFIDIIRKAVDQGFKEAKGLMGALPPAVDNLNQETYQKVQTGLDQLFAPIKADDPKTEIKI